VTAAAPQIRPAIRFRGRSFLALVLAPVAPLEAWFEELDLLASRSPGFFTGRPVVLDVAGLSPSPAREALTDLVGQLSRRSIRVMAIESADQAALDPSLPPPIAGGRDARPIDPEQKGRGAASSAPPAQRSGSLTLETPVRSGQTIANPTGDVIVLGSVSSGAEIIAGGSIHVYGTLRGRAIAGTTGHAGARIFCRRLEAELLAIDGLYSTADSMDPALRGKATQAWLEGDAMRIAALD
jgi:septum site-determining protein MinC